MSVGQADASLEPNMGSRGWADGQMGSRGQVPTNVVFMRVNVVCKVTVFVSARYVFGIWQERFFPSPAMCSEFGRFDFRICLYENLFVLFRDFGV